MSKKIIKNLFLTGIVLLTFLHINLGYSQNTRFLNKEKASELAQLWLSANISPDTPQKFIDKISFSIALVEKNSIPLYYICNSEAGGFVLISAVKSYFPVIAFSTETSFPTQKLPSALKLWLDNQENRIIKSMEYNSVPENINNQWEELMSGNICKKKRKISASIVELSMEPGCIL